MPAPGSYKTRGQSIAIVGYDDTTREFKFKNSWSTSFGVSGYGYLPYDFISGYTIEAPSERLVSDCWMIESVEYERDFVVLRAESVPEGQESFRMGVVSPTGGSFQHRVYSMETESSLLEYVR